jgi:energy-coupling factor transporter ATP-binding protein EcfA2
VYLEQVRIRNIRRFESLDLDLTAGRQKLAGWTVIAGPNASGKTTLLQAVAASLLGPTGTAAVFKRMPDWLRHGQPDGRVEVELRGDPEADGGASELPQQRVKLTAGWSRTRPSSYRLSPAKIGSAAGQFGEAATAGAEPSGWFLAGYGANRLAAPPTVAAQEVMDAAPRLAAVATLFRRDATLHGAAAWAGKLAERAAVRRVAQRHLERHGVHEDLSDLADDEAVRLAGLLPRLLSQGLLATGVGRESDRVELRSAGIFVRQGDLDLPIVEMGQGFESLALLVSDILKQMRAFFGARFMEGWSGAADEPVVVQHPGVVLIDEVENHLHPQLQQQIGFWLTEHFPNVQFVVTTHSPFICQAADQGALYRLTMGGEVLAVGDHTYSLVVNGTVDDAVITELFGLETAVAPRGAGIREELAALEGRILRGEELPPADKERRQRLLAKLPDDPNTRISALLEGLERQP